MTGIIALVLWLRQYSIIPVVIVFCALVIWTYWPSRKDRVEQNGRIPFDDEL
jgi:cbb3-type cytochrome oxidase subunit 3